MGLRKRHLESVDSTGGSEPPEDAGMEQRVTKLEAILPTLATKTDLTDVRMAMVDMKAELIKWMVGAVLAGVAITISVVMGFGSVLLNATRQQAAAPPQPIVIQIPGPQAPAPTPPAK